MLDKNTHFLLKIEGAEPRSFRGILGVRLASVFALLFGGFVVSLPTMLRFVGTGFAFARISVPGLLKVYIH